MNKMSLSVIVGLLFVQSCSNNPYQGIEDPLKEKVFASAGVKELKKYRTENITITDTITVSDSISAIMQELQPFIVKKDLNDFTKKRNQEFKEFRRDGASYEREVMRGSLKDASPWCTEIRQITEKADSLIKNWEKVSPYDYEYMYLNIWYLNRQQKFYQTQYENTTRVLLKELPKHKVAAENYKKLLQKPSDEILYYKVLYVYSFYNPIVENKVRVSKNATLSPDWKLINMTDAGFEVIH